MSQLIKVVGFDPSLRHWGIAAGTYDLVTKEVVVENLDIIEPEFVISKQVRQNSLDIQASNVLFTKAALYLKEADSAFIEVPVGSQNARAMASYGVCIGVIGSLEMSYKPMIQLSPLEVKMASVGIKTATKDQMIQWAMSKHPHVNWPKKRNAVVKSTAEHMADAVAAIYAGVISTPFLQTVNLMRKDHANQS
jgi:Holliday junction resolvasome RuvABC endonuclease subunit